MSYSTLSLKTAFTGIQPFGRLHLGNYFGAIKWMIEQQDKPDMRRFFCLVDLHSFTSSERRTIADDTLKAASTLLACGLDPRKTILFRQSDVLEHANLMWLLMSSVSVSQLQRMIQWKEKSLSLGTNVALLSYPVLQAADILLYRADYVPVGVDQVQHLEFTIRIAEKLNQRRNEIFNVPNAVVFESKIKSLSNPSAKMSKSDNSPHGCLYITDTPEVIETKVTRAVTDCHPGISYDPKLRPGVSSLVQLYSHCTNKAIGDIEAMYSNHKSCSDLKRDLARVIANRFESARESFELLVRRPYEVEEILKAGAAAARVVASETYSLIRSTLLL